MSSVHVDRDILTGVLSQVLETMAGAKLAPGPRGDKPLTVAAMVGLSGKGLRMVVILQMPQELGRRLAAGMLQDPGLSWGRDAEDALAELTNIVAGNLKPHVMPGMSLALPTVACGKELEVFPPRVSEQRSEVYECLGEPLVVTLAREG